MAEHRHVLLIVEDDPALQKQMRWSFDQFETVVAADGESALAQMRRHEPAVITMDLGLPPAPDDTSEGFRLLEQILTFAPETKVIVLTGQNDRANAVKAIGLGAYDFFAKPFEPEMLTLTIERAFRLHDLQAENQRLQQAVLSADSGLLTRDAQMLKIQRTVEKLAPTNATVLLLGDSGTGKELLARALHEKSSRKRQKFVAINCAAIPENLLESELFGYEKGAFTGAVKQTPGKIEIADKGTLFLDEIGDLPAPLQAKLLRFLQERKIERLGGREEIAIDTRVVCATHRDLKALIQQGAFREDLYYRLAEITIEIPPLRDRQGDSVLLARAFLHRFSKENNRTGLRFQSETIAAIEAHPWPGNVRELENAIKRGVIMADGPMIQPQDIGLSEHAEESGALNLRQVREQAEQRAVVRALERADGNVAKAADLLGISRPTLYELMTRFGLK